MTQDDHETNSSVGMWLENIFQSRWVNAEQNNEKNKMMVLHNSNNG